MVDNKLFHNLFSQILSHHLNSLYQKTNFDSGADYPLTPPFSVEDRDIQATPFMKEPYYSSKEPMTITPEILAELFKTPKGNYRTPIREEPPQSTYEGWPNQVFYT